MLRLKTLLLPWLLLPVFLIAGCDQPDNTPKNNENTARPIKIGIAHCCSQTDVFMNSVLDVIRQEATASHAQIEFLSADGSQEKQLQDIAQLIAKKPDVILISRVTDADPYDAYGQQLVKEFKKTNIPVVFYIRGLKDTSLYERSQQFYYAGSYSPKSGIVQAEMIMKHLDRNPQWDRNGDGIIQYVMLRGPLGNSDADARSQWVPSTLAGYPNHNIKFKALDVQICHWRRLDAKKQMLAWLNSDLANSIELVISNNDDMALGALDAIREKNVSLPIYGVNALPEALKLINAGVINGTVSQDSTSQAQAAWRLAYNLATHQDIKHGFKKSIITNNQAMVPATFIDKENVNNFLQ